MGPPEVGSLCAAPGFSLTADFQTKNLDSSSVIESRF